MTNWASKIGMPPRKIQLLVPVGDAENNINERISLGNKFLSVRIEGKSDHERFGLDVDKWHNYNITMLEEIFDNSKIAKEYVPSTVFVVNYDTPLLTYIENSHRFIRQCISNLESIKERLDLYGTRHNHFPQNRNSGIAETRISNDVFIVHGHDIGLKDEVALLISKLKLTPVILLEKSNKGETIIEKLENHSGTGYAIILFSPDDLGEEFAKLSKLSKGDIRKSLRPRARQNVILELGYFIGKLGREKVCVIKKGELEIPSDLHGVLYLPYDIGGGWKLRLAQELKASGYNIDLNNL